MRTHITYISKQPKCRYCGELMKEWTLFLPEEQQAHPECASKARAEILLQELQRDWEEREKPE